MTKDVLLSLSGIQKYSDEDTKANTEPIELITEARYYMKNNRHYVLYEEYQEDGSVSKNTLIFREDYMSLMKRGDIKAHILVEKGKCHSNAYATNAGILQIAIKGSEVRVGETEREIIAKASYEMLMNDEHVADCDLHIRIFEKES